MGTVPTVYININIPTDTMLKFDTNIDIDANCERSLVT